MLGRVPVEVKRGYQSPGVSRVRGSFESLALDAGT